MKKVTNHALRKTWLIAVHVTVMLVASACVELPEVGKSGVTGDVSADSLLSTQNEPGPSPSASPSPSPCPSPSPSDSPPPPAVQAPTSVSYPTTAISAVKGTAITPVLPTVQGDAATSFSISPSLPMGLSLNSTNGRISGTPTVLLTLTSFTVTAMNSGGSKTTTIGISVVDVAPSNLTYTALSATYTVGTAITQNAPSSQGGPVVSYEISPALPAGLSFNTSNGRISGTPTAAKASAKYTVTARNTGGSATVQLTIVVNPAPAPQPSGTPSPAPSGAMTVTQIPASGGDYGYVEYLPPGYESGSNYPLVFFMHGLGKVGNGTTQLGNVRSEGLPAHLEGKVPGIPRRTLNAVVIAPQTSGSWSDYEMIYNTKPFIEKLFAKYGAKVNKKRLYVTGLSLGGSGTQSALAVFPELIAAAVNICGGGYNYTDAAGAKVVAEKVAVWQFNSMDDSVARVATPGWSDVLGNALGVSPKFTDSYPKNGDPWTGHIDPSTKKWVFVNGLTELDASGNRPSIPILHTIWQDNGHGIWDEVYKQDKLYDWMFRQSRQ